MQLQEKIQTEGKVYVERGEQATEKRQQLQAKLADLREQLRVLEGEEQDCTQTIETSKSELRKISEIFAEEERRLDTTQRQNEAKELEFENKLVRRTDPLVGNFWCCSPLTLSFLSKDVIRTSQARVDEASQQIEGVRKTHVARLATLKTEIDEHGAHNKVLQHHLALLASVHERIVAGVKEEVSPEVER